MSLIKIILIIPLVLLIILFVLQLRNRTVYRLTFIFIALLGIVFVITPDLTTIIAHKLNVGRGTDLILYMAAISGFVAMIFIYSKQRKIERTQTEIVRAIAIENAKKPSTT